MNDYVFLFRGGIMATDVSPEILQQHMSKWTHWVSEMGKAGQCKGGQPLDRGGKVLKGKKRTVTDGPYAESKDLLTGYLLISAKSMDDAAKLAQGCPIYEYDGSVEIRQVLSME